MLALFLSSLLAFAADPFAACEAQLAETPDAREPYRCFYMTARRSGAYDQAIARLRPIAEAHPDRGWAQLTYANLLMDQFDPSCRQHYETALTALDAMEDRTGRVFVRLNFANWLYNQGEHDRADALLQESAAIAEAAGNQELWAISRLQMARVWVKDTRNLGETFRIAKEVEAVVFPDGEYQARLLTINILVDVYLLTDRRDEALRELQRLIQLGESEGDRFIAGWARNRLLAFMAEDPDGTAWLHGGDLLGFARETLAKARESGNPGTVIQALATLAYLEPDPAAAEALFAEALALAEAADEPMILVPAITSWANALRHSDPARALPLAEYAERVSRDADDTDGLCVSTKLQGELLIALGRRDEGLKLLLASLDLLEGLRDSTEDDVERAGYASKFDDWYYDIAEFQRAGGTPADLEAAWQMMERMRAIAVREALDRASAGQRIPVEAARQLAAVDAEIATERQRLWADDVTDDQRDQTRLRLVELRDRRATLRADNGLASRPTARPTPSLGEVRAALGPGEVLLSYHLGPEAPWLLKLTRDREQMIELTDRVGFERRVPAYVGLFAARDGGEGEASAALYADLLAMALEGVPDGARLVIVPDGPLHTLPFAALRATAAGPALAERFELSIAPSGAVWHHWRSTAPVPRKGALVVADPAAGTELARLPYARVEGAWTAERWGSPLLVDGDATEAAVKGAAFDEMGIVYLAAHAVLDHVYPDQSAILLAPSDDDDGRLTVPEVARLPLDGQVVVLSACQSASGKVLGGEGPIGLSRSFFQAGARTVVGTLWPLRDDDAEALFGSLSRHLAAGRPVGEALARAQRERIAAGAPPEAWAGVVVVGDAAATVPAPRSAPYTALAGGVLVLMLAGGLRAVVRQRAARS